MSLKYQLINARIQANTIGFIIGFALLVLASSRVANGWQTVTWSPNRAVVCVSQIQVNRFGKLTNIMLQLCVEADTCDVFTRQPTGKLTNIMLQLCFEADTCDVFTRQPTGKLTNIMLQLCVESDTCDVFTRQPTGKLTHIMLQLCF